MNERGGAGFLPASQMSKRRGEAHGSPAEQEVAGEARHAPAHDFLAAPALAVEPVSGETHRRHHISPSGYYRGKKVVKTKADE